jgi:RNA polymerase sigma factor (sigma-70 family)
MKPDELPRIAYDEAVMERFYREHVEAVQRFVARRVGEPQLAADLTADVFLAAIDGAPSYDARRGTPASWLFGIARNVVSSEYRRAARERNAHARVEGRRLLDDDDVIRIQERIDAEARTRELHGALANLPAGERAVFELVALDGLRCREAAAALGIRPVTARVRLHRARTSLRRRILDEDTPTLSQPLEA